MTSRANKSAQPAPAQPTPDAARDTHWMGLALAEAELAYQRGDWPTGAVVVKDGQLLACGQNRQVSTGDALLHAEPDALRQAWAQHGPVATQGATLYCTMEPCPMCAGALKLAGITRLVLALRHAQLQRSDLGDYTVERFCTLTGHAMAIDDGVLEEPYLALRLRWGKNPSERRGTGSAGPLACPAGRAGPGAPAPRQA